MSKPRGPYAPGHDITLLGSGIRVRQAYGKRSESTLGGSRAPKTVKVAPDTAPHAPDGSQSVQRLILEGFPTTAEVKTLGPNSGTANRYAVAAIRSRIQHWVKIEVGIQMIAPVPPPVRVTLRYVFSDNRHRDDGNFSLVAKPVIDGLVRSGILAGDNHARLTERVEFVKEPGARRLEIVLAHGEPGDGEGER